MNYICSNSSSDIAPRWRNNNLSTGLTKISGHKLLVYPERKNIEQINCVRERIISVQEQRQAKEEILPSIQCKSNYTDKCYAEYNLNSLRRGFGQLKGIRYETMEPGKPSLVIHSSTLEKNENDIVTLTNRVLKELNKIELRKRFAVVHAEKDIYVIGGYIYDHHIPARRKPSHDYKYDIQTRKLIPTQALPNGAIGFGLCVDDDCIYVVGGNDVNNRPLSDCYYLTTKNSNETWIKLSDLPAPTSGPGVGVYNGELHCIGGYDVLGNESIAHGEYIILRDRHDKRWEYAPEIDPLRARPLVFIIAGDSINGQSVYAAGGFNVNPTTNKAYIVPDLQLFNQSTQRWQRLTTIPHLELSHALSFSNNKLCVSETIDLPDQLPVTNILRTFDLQKLIWTNAKDDFENKKMKEQNRIQASPSPSTFNLSPDAEKMKEIKTNRNIQIDRSNLSAKTKMSTLKRSNSKTQPVNIKSGFGATPLTKTRPMDQHSNGIRNKIPINTKRNNISQSYSPNPSLKKTSVTPQQVDRRL